MRIAILTSSRADYGIYKPLIKALKSDTFFQTGIIAFGSHLSPYHGQTIDNIISDGYAVDHKISSLLITDNENGISGSMGLTIIKFAEFWENHKNDFDLVFCLGDRFEMFSAVISGLTYGIRFAHIHGGETTLGAIDNVFRHSITMSSTLHFVSTPVFAGKVKSLLDQESDHNNIIVSGALSLDNILQLPLLNKEEFLEKWQINLSIPSVLITIHPETVNSWKNEEHLEEIKNVLIELKEKYQLIITMPNADTNGSIYRKAFEGLGREFQDKIKLVENFGTQSYFSCMKEVNFMLGNTSSGIIEAASFHKYVINIGDRQKGREAGENVFHVPIKKMEITKVISRVELLKGKQLSNIYFNGGAVEKIIGKLKSLGK